MKIQTQKIKEYLLRIDYRHFLCVGLTIGTLFFWLYFPNALGRLLEGFRDIGTSFAYFLMETVNNTSKWFLGGLFHIDHGIVATVNELPQYSGTTSLPLEWEIFVEKWNAYWTAWANWDNVRLYFLYILLYTPMVAQILTNVFVLIWLLRYWLKRWLKSQPDVEFDEHGKAVNAAQDSIKLQKFREFTFKWYLPVKYWIKAFFGFLKLNDFWWKIWLGLWAFYFNGFAIALELISFLLYWLSAFDFEGIYRQVYKLALDLSTLLKVPSFTWIILGVFAFLVICKRTGDERLEHWVNYDRGFGNTRSLFTIICATVGAGKTTTLVQMGLLDCLNHRDRAFEDMLKNDLKFPNFPWINLEKSIQRAIENGLIKNLKTTRDFIHKRYEYFEKNPSCRRCFGYDYQHYGYTYNDGLKVSNVWQVIESYAQQYFIYISKTCMLANFGVRLDDIKKDLGHFPIWNSDLLNRNPELMSAYSRHCKILDFNALRIGMKMVTNNDYVYNFEFGTILITEIGKELMNDKELREMGIKFIALDANQRNDGTINEIKLIRHSATVDGFPYVVIRADEQRPESLGANLRDLFEIVHIRERSERKCALPCFALVDLIYAAIFNKFAQVYYQYRFQRSDNTLVMHLLKSFTAWTEHTYMRACNRYGYRVIKGELERGTQDGNLTEFKYYLIDKIIYARRFATDCYSGYFEERIAECTVGLDSLPEYKTEKATFAEMQQQNSYMVKNLLEGINKEK